MKHVSKNQKPSPPVQITMYLAQHARHAIPITHTVMAAVSAMHIAMRPNRTLVPSYRVHNPKTVHRIPVARVHREHATGVITSLQPIHPAHQITVPNLWRPYRARRDITNRMYHAPHAQTNPTTVITPAPHRPMHVRGNAMMDIL